MRVLIIFLFGMGIATLSLGQQYDIKKESQRVNNKKYEGISSKVDGEFIDVEEFWLSYLKDYGKSRRKRNYYQLTEFSINDLGVDTLTYVTRVESAEDQELIWLAPFSDGLSETEVSDLNADIEKILKLATRAYYVNEVQDKIDQAESAAVSVSKSHQRLMYDGEKLVADLEGAEQLKADLETRLQETDLKIKVLSQQIIDNKLAVDSVYNDLEQVKKVIDGHKESMKKIN